MIQVVTRFMLEMPLFCLRNFDFLIPDAPELVFGFLEKEQDASCKRNAFMMLVHADQVGKLFIALVVQESQNVSFHDM